MGSRAPQEPQLPPSLGGIVVDGANVTATSTVFADRRLELAVQWFRRWRPDLPVVVFLDSATLGRCAPAARARLQQKFAGDARGGAEDAGVTHVVTPRGTPADALLLQRAAADRALVVSNDRFADHAELRRGVLTVQFECAGDDFAPYAEATWFTPAGGATRVPMVVLRGGTAS